MCGPPMGYHSQSREWPSLYKSSIMCQGLPRTAKLQNRLPNMLHASVSLSPALPLSNGTSAPSISKRPSFRVPSSNAPSTSVRPRKQTQTKSDAYANAFMVWQMPLGTSIFTCVMSYWLLESHQANSIMAYTLVPARPALWHPHLPCG